MGIPVLEESCFGCCSIPTGARIISWLSVITSAIIFLVLLLIELAIIAAGNIDMCNGDIDCINNFNKNDQKVVVILFAVIIGIVVLLQGLLFIVGIVNLCGVYKEKPSYMVPYLILSAITLFFEAFGILVDLVNNGINGNTASSIFGLGIGIYFFLIVHSYFKVLKNGQNNGMVL